MRSLCRAFGALALAIGLAAQPAAATSFSTDQSDLYYIAAESGWGIQLVQRGSVIFATMFVYGPNGAPTWYVATMSSTDGITWTGDLLATTGPYFATVPFNPLNVTVTKVGTMTWAPQTTASGLLTYDVNGIAIAKNVTRETLVLDDYSGTYLGAVHASATGCTSPSDNAPPFDFPLATITVSQSGQSITMTISVVGVALMISGTLSQDGQFGSITGTYTSPDEVGNASVSQMNVQAHSLAATFSLQSTNLGCLDTGYFAGMRSAS
jgi:hypothetical protein